MQTEVIWSPIKGTSQELALDTRCDETFFCGTRGPGKTDTQLMRFRRFVGIGYGPFWRGIIFDREYKNLDDLVTKSKRWFHAFNDGARFLSSKGDYKWTWPTGEELLFRVIKKADDYWDYHGHEYPFEGWNELTKYPTSELYDLMLSCNRSSFTPEKDSPKDDKGNIIELLPKIPLQNFSTGNPHGAGHNWVKERFIDPAPYGTVVKKEVEVFNPQTQKDEIITKTQIAIFGTYKENIYLAPEYIASLHQLTENNEVLKEAWLKGNWDIVSGGALDGVWKAEHLIKDRFVVPKSWRIDRSFDWGSTHPFSVGWWAEANGEEATMLNGEKFCPKPGSLIQIAEWYGTKKIGTNKGLIMSATDIALGIIQREVEMMENGWILTQPWAGPADNQIGNTTEIDVETIAVKMAKHGIRWLPSDKSPGSRVIGLQIVRDRLEASIKGEGPGLYFMNNCQASIKTLPTLPRDTDKQDDVDCFVAGTLVETENGSLPIEQVKQGTLVKTPVGFRKVIASYESGLSETIIVKLKNGISLEGTPRHKVYVENIGMVRLDNLGNGLTLTQKTCILSICENKSSTEELPTHAQKGVYTIHQERVKFQAILKAFTEGFGLTITGQFLKVFIFTILTKIQITMLSKIFNVLKAKSILSIILRLECKKAFYLSKLKNGEKAKREKQLSEKTLERCLIEHPLENLRVRIVKNLLKQTIQHKNVAAMNVQHNIFISLIQKYVKFAETLFLGRKQNIEQRELAVISVVGCLEKKKVYNITVEQAHLFYANGLLVTNTDSEDHPYDMVRYRCNKGNNREAKTLDIKLAN